MENAPDLEHFPVVSTVDWPRLRLKWIPKQPALEGRDFRIAAEKLPNVEKKGAPP